MHGKRGGYSQIKKIRREKNPMKKEKRDEAQALIEAAVAVACEACMKGIDEKIQAAVNLGVTIGAAAGAEVGAAAAVKAVERERARLKRQHYDNRLHNTKLLLRHYRSLNEHYKHAVFDTRRAEEADITFADIMQSMNSTMTDEELYVESIKQSCVRTKVIMAHVNKMLDIYRIMCRQSKRPDDARRWRVLAAMYLDDTAMTAGTIAKKENINRRTVYKDIDCCVADLTALLFGIDGVSRG